MVFGLSHVLRRSKLMSIAISTSLEKSSLYRKRSSKISHRSSICWQFFSALEYSLFLVVETLCEFKKMLKKYRWYLNVKAWQPLSILQSFWRFIFTWNQKVINIQSNWGVIAYTEATRQHCLAYCLWLALIAIVSNKWCSVSAARGSVIFISFAFQ